ncbi:conserved hypothetical protein [Thermotomaculum hydrothermale]|uniref:Hemerythrin-like domain-containing protein n=1 Tax=Thermotomaculum hydrothermale TaxID=981385 RepID=A0A7R6PQU0_9BACT|nr:PAS domain-containing protein [Thermotomaculum hydrothermale]BBB32651.1 conserved hypothetical protein [Thermotomaculum hydrothermale]
MSGYNKEKREKFYQYCKGILEGQNGKELFEKNKSLLETITPRDVIEVFHFLVEDKYPIEKIKKAVNKILHTVYIPLRDYKSLPFSENGLIDLLVKDNLEMEKRLNKIKPLIKSLNKEHNEETIKKLHKMFSEISEFSLHYVVKENTIFPFLEKKSEFFGCTQIMWSFDDDIKKNIKNILTLLEGEFNLKDFNILSGRLFFDMFAISFRENKILFPYLLEIAEEKEINLMLDEVYEMGLPFVKVEKKDLKNKENTVTNDLFVDLGTGKLKPEQITLIFNHLPVDITYVDENNEVKFFSTPKERIFPRTKSVLGRKVQNCHPPESIDTVNKIVESFKNGEKDRADFWINFKGKFILIQYFAVRNEKGEYKGVLEVTQDITNTKSLEGEKRLLDWEN